MTDAVPNLEEVTFEEFCEEWLSEFREGDLSAFKKGQQFAIKLVTQWLGVTEDDEDLVLCDGSGDGGIDIAYLHRADIDDSEQEGQSVEGDTWYLIQSKYGTAFQGSETIIDEARKVITTLAGENTHLSEQVSQLLGRLNTFRQKASERDRIILVFATDRPITESDRQALNDVRSIGRERFPNIFDVEDISLQTIWEVRDTVDQTSISLPIVLDFLRDTLLRAHLPHSVRDLTNALLILLLEENRDALQGLVESSLEVLAEYLNQSSEDSVYEEPIFQADMDLNAFLKRYELGRNEDSTPRFKSLLSEYKRLFGRRLAGQPSPRELVTQAVTAQDSV